MKNLITNIYVYPRARIQQTKETKKLYNLPSDFEQKFSRDWLDEINFSLDTDFQRNVVSQAPSEVVKNFLLAKSEFWKEFSVK